MVNFNQSVINAVNNAVNSMTNSSTTTSTGTTVDAGNNVAGYSTTSGTPTSYTVVVNSDNIDGKSTDKERIKIVCDALRQAGYTAVESGVGPNWHVTDMRTHKNSYIVCIVGGLCAGTIQDYGAKYYQNYMSQNNNRGGQALYGKHSKYKVPLDQLTFLERAWDDNFSPSGFKGINNPAQYMKEHHFDYCIGGIDGDNNNFAQSVVNMVKTGVGIGGNGGGGSVNVTPVEGTLFSARGETPQFWNTENFHFPIETRFTNFEIQEENPRIRTATFESPDNIDLTEGRVAVLITGDCNDFGGIIIKKEHDAKTGLYKYQCQGFMERIMASPVYVVANGGKTAHRLIQEYLSDIGLPDTCLGSEDDYDIFIEEELRRKLKADEDLAETSDIFVNQEDYKTSTNNGGTSSSSSSSSSSSTSSSSGGSGDGSSTKTIKTVTETLSSDEEKTMINTFKRKPVGIYDKVTGGDFIRTLIYDYGINVDFYGDINGIPHFDIMDMDVWTRSGWILMPDMGFEEDYNYTFDITNIVTQVGVKNIQAINGNGELYTSEELLGVNIENFVGRMGTIVDNPSERSAVNQGETVQQITSKYQDSNGNTYENSEVLNTEGEPSCGKCAYKQGGLQPPQKMYQKAWLNKCPGCETKGKLKAVTKSSGEDPHGVTVCESCGLKYCQFCGYERDNGTFQLTELFRTDAASQDNLKSSNGTESTSNTSTTNNNTTNTNSTS